MAVFAILDSTLTAHNYRVRNYNFLIYFVNWVFLKFLKKITKIVISSKLKRFWAFVIRD